MGSQKNVELASILIIEDNPGDRDLLIEYLEMTNLKFKIETAERLSDSLKILKDNTLSLIFVDLGLPDSQGIKTAEGVLDAAVSVPIIVLTGNDDDELSQKAIRAGAQDYLVKGNFTPDLLARTIRHAIERKSQSIRLDQINRILSSIRNINQLIVREKDPRVLAQQACDLLYHSGGFDFVWIILRNEDGSFSETVTAGGKNVDAEFTDIYSDKKLPPCAHRLLESKQKYISTEYIEDICKDCQLKDESPASREIICKLEANGQVYGFLGVYSSDKFLDSYEEIELILEVEGDIAFALYFIESEKQKEAVERRNTLLVDNSISAIAIHEMIFDENDTPIDYIFLSANPAFELHTGLSSKDIIGKRVTEVIPEITKTDYIQRYGEVVKSGKPITFESYSKPLDRHFSTNAFKIEDNKFGTIFIDISDRIRSENALRESEKKFHALYETMAQGVVYQDIEGKITAANAAAEEILGLSFEQMQGRKSIDPGWKTIHTDGSDFPGEDHYSMKALKTGKTCSGVMGVYNPRDNSHHWIRVYAIPDFHNGEKKPYQVFATFEDITKLRETEIEILELNKRLSLAVEAGNIGLWDWNLETNEVFYSKEWKAQLGYEPDELEDNFTTFENLMHPDDRERISKEVNLTIENPNHTFSPQLRLKHKDGSYRWISARGAVFKNDDGKSTRMLGTHIDITESKIAEQELKRSLMSLELAEEISNTGYYERNWQTGKGYWSEGYYHLMGLEPEGENSHELTLQYVHPDDRDFVEEQLKNSLENRESTEFDFRIIRPDGEIRHIHSIGKNTFDEDGRALSTYGTFQDVTSMVEVQNALLESKRILDSTGTIAKIGGWEHNLKTGKAVWTKALYDIVEIPHDEEPPGVNEHLEFYPQPYAQMLEVAYENAINTGEPFDLELQVITKQKKQIWCRVKGESIIVNGECVGLRGTFQDVTQLRTARSALVERDRQLRTLMDNLPGIAYRCENKPEWSMLMMSKGTRKLLGYEPDIFINGEKSFLDVIHKDDRERVWETIQEKVKQNKVFEIEYRILTSSQEEKWVYERGRAVKDDKGSTLIEGLIIDITAKIIAERELEENLKKYRLLAENTVDSIWQMTLDGRFTYINPAIEKLLGYSAEEMVGTHLSEHCDEKNYQLMENVIHQAIVALPNFERALFEAEMIRRDGVTIDVEITGKILVDEDGAPIALQGVTREITERKKAEQALRQSQQNLMMAQQTANLGSWRWEIESDSLYWSEQMYRIFGIDQRTFTGKLSEVIDLAIHPEDREIVEASNRSVIEKGIPVPVVYRIVRPDEEVRHVYAEAGELENDAEGKPLRLSGIVMDITERKVAEEERNNLQDQLNQAQKMESVGRLAGGVAHDFNNMLQAILGNCELARMMSKLDHHMDVALTEIEKAAKRSANLTGQLLAFARKQTISPKVVDINDSISGMLKMLKRLIGEDINLAWMPGSEIGSVYIDPTQVDQILANLTVNARDAISGQGKITVETRNISIDEAYVSDHPVFHQGEFVMLAVSDDGSGMDKELVEKIFEPFFTTKESGEGTGLGLSTIYGIVKQNNGFINVYSEPGEGTTFKIYLPRYHGDVKTDENEKSKEIDLRGTETIVVVEDEVTVLKLADAILSNYGYSVHTFLSPEEAIQFASSHEDEVDLLITDVIMPSMNGKELAAKISEIIPGLKAIYMSGYTANVIAHRGVLEEGVNFLQKPFRAVELEKKVREVLDS
ncbi:PAS domain-containing protein [bacterium]|nr:PAS domain-containing protein [bacterium]